MIGGISVEDNIHVSIEKADIKKKEISTTKKKMPVLHLDNRKHVPRARTLRGPVL